MWAEKLLWKWDMLFKNEWQMKRLQWFYINTTTKEKVIDKFEQARQKALKQRNEAFGKYKKWLPQGNTSFEFILKNGTDKLKDDITEFEIDTYLNND